MLAHPVMQINIGKTLMTSFVSIIYVNDNDSNTNCLHLPFAKMTSRPGSMRNLGNGHIVFGILLTIFGIAEFQVTSKANVFLRYFLSKGETYYFGVWIGIWVSNAA